MSTGSLVSQRISPVRVRVKLLTTAWPQDLRAFCSGSSVAVSDDELSVGFGTMTIEIPTSSYINCVLGAKR